MSQFVTSILVGCYVMSLFILKAVHMYTKARQQEEKQQRQAESIRQALRTIELFWEKKK
uniref:Uncharacterized protein n=1 Tax=viral metagenome TaxID=1070528 RepID=A0A6M3KZ56_9ZZZZ